MDEREANGNSEARQQPAEKNGGRDGGGSRKSRGRNRSKSNEDQGNRQNRRPDPGKGRDVCELADPRVCDIRVSVTIAVVAQNRVRDAAATTDLDVSPEGAVRDLALGVEERGVGRQARHRQNARHQPGPPNCER